MKITSLVHILAPAPQRVFLLDSAGACYSALLLGLVLASCPTLIGVPQTTLYELCTVASILCLSSLGSYIFLRHIWRTVLRFIAVANLLYCLYTALLVFQLWHEITFFGIVYFAVEILIIVALAFFELWFSRRGGTLHTTASA